MFLGVVARPIEAKGFNGKIFLDRVAEETEYLKTTCTQRFSDHAGVNWNLRRGEWIDLLTDDDDISLGEFKEAMAGNPNYNLDQDVVDRLVFRYSLGPDKNGKPKWAYFADDEDVLWEKERMRACQLRVRYQGKTKEKDGDPRVKDVNCDSDYMKNVMPKVGKVRKQTYSVYHRPHG